eukprot:18103-Prorocentrum_minimum.AAC.2
MAFSGEGYETPGKPSVASTPMTSRVGGNPPLRLDRPKWQDANLPELQVRFSRKLRCVRSTTPSSGGKDEGST